MLFGPIVNAELVRMARQRRWYVFRVLIGLGLLLGIYQTYMSVFAYAAARSAMMELRGLPSGLDRSELAHLASRIFTQFGLAQGIIILFLAPTLTAGAIAEEKQRKTLHYLMASCLSSTEIVLGKLFARLLMVAMPLAVGLPILALLGTLGGIEPMILLCLYGGTASIALFEASLALLISTLCRRSREALILAFLASGLWLFGPAALEGIATGAGAREPWPDRYRRWVEPINRILIASGPFGLIGPNRSPATPGALIAAVWRMVGLQAIGTVICLALATWQLRPAFRHQDGAPPFRLAWPWSKEGTARRTRNRPHCGDDAMRWKETIGGAGSGLLRLVSLIGVAAVVVMAADTLREQVPEVWNDLRSRGWTARFYYPAVGLNGTLRAMATGLFAVTTLLLAGLSATSVSREREDDTWTSLIATPLSGRDILGAKLYGCLWAVRPLLTAIAAVWAFGLALGAFHPVGVLISAVQLAGIGLFVVALGTSVSLGSKTTMRATALTIAVLLFLTVGSPLIISMTRGHSPFIGVICPPYLIALGMLSYPDAAAVSSREILREVVLASWDFVKTVQPGTNAETIRAVVVGTLAYLAAGPLLLAVAYRRFDRLLDRPRRRTLAGPMTAARAGAETATPPASPA